MLLNRVVVRVLTTALLAVVALAPGASAHAATFGVLYTGTSGDSDADYIRDFFASVGWTQEVFKTSENPSMQPYHYHFTHGANDNMVQAGDDCDLLYVSGHGFHQAMLPIFNSSGVMIDSISPLQQRLELGDWRRLD